MWVFPRARFAEAEARLAELAATRKVIDGLTPPDHEPTSAKTDTVYQCIVTAFNEHPEKVFRVHDQHEELGLPTDEPSINVTRSRLDDSLARDSSLSPDVAGTRNGLNAHSDH